MLAGNNLAALYVLELLVAAVDTSDVLVIAPEPGRPSLWQASLASHAERLDVSYLSPREVNDEKIVRLVEEHGPGLLLSVYYTQIFRPGLLEAVAGPALNFHPSLLPRHRGVAPLIWAIVEGDAATGVTVHHIDEGIDTGRIVLQYRIPIHVDDTGYVLHRKVAKLVRAAAAELLRTYLAGSGISRGEEQSGIATYHSPRDPQVNHLDWSWPGRRIRDVVRALAPPLPGAFSLLNGEELVIARVATVAQFDERWKKPPGMVELRRGQPPIVWAVDGPLQLLEFVDGKDVVRGDELRGRRGLAEGQLLT